MAGRRGSNEEDKKEGRSSGASKVGERWREGNGENTMELDKQEVSEICVPKKTRHEMFQIWFLVRILKQYEFLHYL
jgi:hypothetical protein